MANAESATLLALGAALMAGVSFVILQRSAQQVTDDVVGHFALFHLSLRNVQWWLGSLAAIGSFVFQALALTMGSVVLVQPLQATALLFAGRGHDVVIHYRREAEAAEATAKEARGLGAEALAVHGDLQDADVPPRLARGVRPAAP